MSGPIIEIVAWCIGGGMCLRFVCSAIGSLGYNLKSLFKTL